MKKLTVNAGSFVFDTKKAEKPSSKPSIDDNIREGRPRVSKEVKVKDFEPFIYVKDNVRIETNATKLILEDDSSIIIPNAGLHGLPASINTPVKCVIQGEVDEDGKVWNRSANFSTKWDLAKEYGVVLA